MRQRNAHYWNDADQRMLERFTAQGPAVDRIIDLAYARRPNVDPERRKRQVASYVDQEYARLARDVCRGLA